MHVSPVPRPSFAMGRASSSLTAIWRPEAPVRSALQLRDFSLVTVRYEDAQPAMAGHHAWSRAAGARCPGSIASPFPLAMSVEYTPAAMASTLTTTDVGGSMLRAPVSSARWQQRLFFTGIPIAMGVAVFVGFAPTYYLKTAYGTPALAPLYHLHGFLFSLWIVLLVAQPALVAARHINLHRRLGTVGGVLAAAMVPTALAVAVDMGRRGAAPPGVPPEMHKRLMLIGRLELLPAGVHSE